MAHLSVFLIDTVRYLIAPATLYMFVITLLNYAVDCMFTGFIYIYIMEQTLKKKHTKFSEDDMREAVELVNSGLSIREAAKRKKLSNETLGRYVRKQRLTETALQLKTTYNYKPVFTPEEEEELVSYIINCSKRFYGLPLVDVRKLALEMATINQIKVPANWEENKMAGKGWLRNFRSRHKQLSLRTPEGCSLARATSFNSANVKTFYENLRNLLTRTSHFSCGSRIYNLDETATVTVHKAPKVLAASGSKQVAKITSGERGILVTTCCIVSASGNALPPAMVFPRVKFQDHMLIGAPPGTLGLATPSGWMNSSLFVQVMEHFIKLSSSSKENPTILIYDNHESHLSIEVINLAKRNGVNILTLPPHSTARMQPLDVAVFKPFKNAYNSAVDSWMMCHPGRPMSIYDVATCVGQAHYKGLTPINITSGFSKTGIFPFCDNIFTEDDFLPASVTDRPMEFVDVLPGPSNMESSTVPNQPLEYSSTLTELSILPLNNLVSEPMEDAQNSPDSALLNKETDPLLNTTNCSASSTASSKFISPTAFRGYPKAGPRRVNRKPRKTLKSIIATDTPEKTILEEKAKLKRPLPQKLHKAKKPLFEEESSSDDNEVPEPKKANLTDDDISEEDDGTTGFEELERVPVIGDFVLTEFKARGKYIYYIGNVLEEFDSKDFKMSFMRKSGNVRVTSFLYPDVPDISMVAISEIKQILPLPNKIGQTARLREQYIFQVEFSSLDLR